MVGVFELGVGVGVCLLRRLAALQDPFSSQTQYRTHRLEDRASQDWSSVRGRLQQTRLWSTGQKSAKDNIDGDKEKKMINDIFTQGLVWFYFRHVYDKIQNEIIFDSLTIV